MRVFRPLHVFSSPAREKPSPQEQRKEPIVLIQTPRCWSQGFDSHSFISANRNRCRSLLYSGGSRNVGLGGGTKLGLKEYEGLSSLDKFLRIGLRERNANRKIYNHILWSEWGFLKLDVYSYW